MNAPDPRFPLSSHREDLDPKLQPELDPLLQRLREDPALADWHRRDQEGDRLLREKLGSLPPPPDLRAQILAGRRPSANLRLSWTAPRLLALAASIALLLGLGARIWLGSGDKALTLAELDTHISNHVLRGTHGGHGSLLSSLQTRLGDPSLPLGKALDLDLSALRSEGCLRLDFAGREVLELCFVRNGIEYHLYLLPSGASPTAGTLQITHREGLSIAHWGDAHRHFALATEDRAGVFDKLF